VVRLPETLPDPALLEDWTRTITMRFAYSRHELATLQEIARKHPLQRADRTCLCRIAGTE
jgi:hypothetical protein